MLDEEIKLEQKEILRLIDGIKEKSLMDDTTEPTQAIAKLKKIEQQYEKSLEKIQQFRSFEGTLGVEAAAIPQVE